MKFEFPYWLPSIGGKCVKSDVRSSFTPAYDKPAEPRKNTRQLGESSQDL